MTSADSALHSDTSFSSGEEVYRSVSRAAIGSTILGVFGLASFPLLFVLVLPMIGLALAIAAFYNFRRYPDELLGRPLATIGLILCLGTVILSPAYHTFIYMTEVPEGYTRIDFWSLASPKDQPDVPTEFALSIDGEQIFIKGYIHPTSMDTYKAKKFVLVPDLGTCCFGGQPPLTHMIEVSLSGKQYAQKSYRKQRLAGELHVDRALKPVDDLEGVFYQLHADIIK